MLHVGLDLSRKRVDVCLISDQGGLIGQFAAPTDRDGLYPCTVFEQYDQPGLQTDERGVFDGGPFRAAWVKDRDGNTMAIAEVTGSASRSRAR